jgi:hypothetical protein
MATLQVFDEFKDLQGGQTSTRDSALAPKVQSELQNWLAKVLKAPANEALTKLLRGPEKANARVTSVINQTNALIAAAFPQLPSNAGQKSNRGLQNSSSQQQQQPQQNQENSKKRMLCLSLYKFCLHRVLVFSLHDAAASLKVSSLSELPDFAQQLALDSVLEETEMLAGLVQACAEIVTYSHLTSVSESFPTCSLRMGRATQWLELLQGLTWIRHCRKELPGAEKEDEGILPGILEFPPQIQEYMLAMEHKILSELLFVTGSTFFPRVKEHGIYNKTSANPLLSATSTINSTEDLKKSMKKAGNAMVLVTILKKFSRLAEQKARDLVHYLWTSSNVSSTSSIDEEMSAKLEYVLQHAVHAMLNSLLYRHMDLLFSRRLTVIVLGIVCCTAKICGFKVKFPAVMKVAVTYFDYEDVEALSQVSLGGVLSMKIAQKAKEKKERKKESRGGSGGGGGCGNESDEGWSDNSSEDEGDYYAVDISDLEDDDQDKDAVGSAKEVS